MKYEYEINTMRFLFVADQSNEQTVEAGTSSRLLIIMIGDRIVTFVMMRSNLSKEMDFGHCLSETKYDLTLCAVITPLRS